MCGICCGICAIAVEPQRDGKLVTLVQGRKLATLLLVSRNPTLTNPITKFSIMSKFRLIITYKILFIDFQMRYVGHLRFEVFILCVECVENSVRNLVALDFIVA